MSFFIRGLSGPIDTPSPNTSSVTPWRMSPCERPSCQQRHRGPAQHVDEARRDGHARARRCLAWPWPGSSSPIAAMRSPAIATSASTPGAPVPSYIVPPRMITRKAGASAHKQSARPRTIQRSAAGNSKADEPTIAWKCLSQWVNSVHNLSFRRALLYHAPRPSPTSWTRRMRPSYLARRGGGYFLGCESDDPAESIS